MATLFESEKNWYVFCLIFKFNRNASGRTDCFTDDPIRIWTASRRNYFQSRLDQRPKRGRFFAPRLASPRKKSSPPRLVLALLFFLALASPRPDKSSTRLASPRLQKKFLWFDDIIYLIIHQKQSEKKIKYRHRKDAQYVLSISRFFIIVCWSQE